MASCPCGSGRDFDACCRPFLVGDDRPATAEALMRARYTAHTLADVAYIRATHDPATRDDIDVGATGRWARRADWLGLDVRAVDGGGVEDDVGAVEFVAHFRERGERRRHHEVARFERGADGAWLYIDGEAPTAGTVRGPGRRVGRNEPCPCGSGRKYKKCCGASA